MSSARWLPLSVAAEALSLADTALRRTLERRARLAPDGVIEAAFDGIRARKFAGRWRVNLGPAWTSNDVPPLRAKPRSMRATPVVASKHATGSEKE